VAVAPGSGGSNRCTVGSPHSGLNPVCGLRKTVGTTNEGNTSSNFFTKYIFSRYENKHFFHTCKYLFFQIRTTSTVSLLERL